MLISNLENVKKEIQITRKGEFAAGIYKDGKLTDNIILADALKVIDAFAKNVINLNKMKWICFTTGYEKQCVNWQKKIEKWY